MNIITAEMIMENNKSNIIKIKVTMELHGNISRNSYGNVVIGRYCDCFEEDVGFMCSKTRESSPMECGRTAKDTPTLDVRKGNANYRRG